MKYIFAILTLISIVVVATPAPAQEVCPSHRVWADQLPEIIAKNGPFITYTEIADPALFIAENGGGDVPDSIGYFYVPNNENMALVVYVTNGCFEMQIEFTASQAWAYERSENGTISYSDMVRQGKIENPISPHQRRNPYVKQY